MNITKYNELYEELKQHLKDNLEYEINVFQTPPQRKKFPVIIFNEITNQNFQSTTDYLERFDTLGYEFDIFCCPSNLSEALKQASEIARECDCFMAKRHFNRVSVNRVPNIDASVYRIIMRYSGSINLKRGYII